MRYYGILLVLCYIFECIFGIIHVGHLHLPALGSRVLYLRTILRTDLASGPQSRRNAEIGSCNRGLFHSEMDFFSTKIVLNLCIFNRKSSLLEVRLAKKINGLKYI